MTNRIEIDLSTGEKVVVPFTPEEEAAYSAAVLANAPIEARNAKLSSISAIEAQITPRRIRDAMFTEAGKAWLASRDAEIAALRSQL